MNLTLEKWSNPVLDGFPNYCEVSGYNDDKDGNNYDYAFQTLSTFIHENMMTLLSWFHLKNITKTTNSYQIMRKTLLMTLLTYYKHYIILFCKSVFFWDEFLCILIQFVTFCFTSLLFLWLLLYHTLVNKSNTTNICAINKNSVFLYIIST